MKLWERRPLCNNNPGSAPHIKGRCFIFCWRCTGGIIGVFIWYLFQRIIAADIKLEALFKLWILTVPACIDYALIKIDKTKPSNIRRFWTGCLLGIPIAETILKLIEMINGW